MTQPKGWTPKEAERLSMIANGTCEHRFNIDVTVVAGKVEKVYCVACRLELPK
jgi:hypothetical protein